MAEVEALARRVQDLKTRLAEQEKEHEFQTKCLMEEKDDLKRFAASIEPQRAGESTLGAAQFFENRVVWTIDEYSKKVSQLEKNQSIWSPKFKAAGLDDVQLEFFPKGREKTTNEGFCSLFLWCTSAPHGTTMKYQLWVGSFLRTPDDEEFNGRIGHGHSNFCPMEPEVDKTADSVCVGVDFLEVLSDMQVESSGLRLTSTSFTAAVAKDVEVIRNRCAETVIWRIPDASALENFPKGASMISKSFAVGGIREMLMEFYPTGSPNTNKEGYCAFYIRCPEAVSVKVTLFVGSVRKGPIKTTFDTQTGKGLPEFCKLQDHIASDGSLEVGIQLTVEQEKTLTMVRPSEVR